jgi:hypothetical protein
MPILAPRDLATGAALLALLGACEAPRRLPPSAALPPPLLGPSEPAPVPSDATDDYVADQAARRQATPSGPDAMPGFGQAQRMGSDMTTAPIPQDRIRPPAR